MASDRGAAVELTAHELEPAWFDCDVLHISGYSLLRDPLATAAAARRRARACSWCERLARRLDVDAGRRRLPRTCARARARHDLRQRTRARRPRREATGARWVVKRGAAGVTRRRRPITPRCPSRSSTRPAPATRSPPASSSTGRRSGSRRPRAAARSSGRCRDQDRRPRARGAGGRHAASSPSRRHSSRTASRPAKASRSGSPPSRQSATAARFRRRSARSTARSSSG